MALPNRSDLMTVNYAWRGAPFVRVEAKPLQTTSVDYAWRGAPFVVGNPAGFFARYHYDFIAQSRLGS